MEKPIKMDDLGVPLFLETPIWLLKGRWEVVQSEQSSKKASVVKEQTRKKEFSLWMASKQALCPAM